MESADLLWREGSGGGRTRKGTALPEIGRGVGRFSREFLFSGRGSWSLFSPLIPTSGQTEFGELRHQSKPHWRGREFLPSPISKGGESS
ncbi:MAG: hypothetical protein C6I05_03590 [Epsilonproteobacteria bacterium]|nr:hypothetical protein [Campylobacterota bacterium]